MVIATKQLQTATQVLSHPSEREAEIWWVRGSRNGLTGVNRHSQNPNPGSGGGWVLIWWTRAFSTEPLGLAGTDMCLLGPPFSFLKLFLSNTPFLPLSPGKPVTHQHTTAAG